MFNDTPVTPQKRCTKCGVEFPATSEYFPPRKDSKDGLRGNCRICERAKDAIYRDTHKEEYRAYHSVYSAKYYADRHEEYRYKHREYSRAYRAAFPEKSRLACATYNAKHREKRLAYSATYRATHNAERRKYWSTYHATPRGQAAIKARDHRRRAHKQSASGSFTAADIQLQIKAQTDKHNILHCWWCGEPITGGYHADHRIPLSRGGSNGPENIVISHPKCNLKKRDKLPGEFMNRLF